MITLEQLSGLVDTIVVVMMENRSFDHVLGFLSHECRVTIQKNSGCAF